MNVHLKDILASFPDPAQLSVACCTEKRFTRGENLGTRLKTSCWLMSCDYHVTSHDPQVGNCVAKRNYRFFYLFLVTITVMSLYVMGCNVAVVVVGKYIQS